VRQHVNPLSRFFQLPRRLPGPTELFPQPERPLHCDIGCARGQFLLAMAEQHPDWNHVGLEIREPLVISAERERHRRDLDNVRFLFSNATVNLPAWLDELPAGLLQRVTIQFPDPWFKRRHRKRRVLQPPLLAAICRALAVGGEMFLQSDVPEAILPMEELIALSGCFDPQPQHAQPQHDPGSPVVNPYPVATEREHLVLTEGRPIRRALLRRNREPAVSARLLEERIRQLGEEPRNATAGR
jgi:tRNA (guanine-N7-)-methyltransferase